MEIIQLRIKIAVLHYGHLNRYIYLSL